MYVLEFSNIDKMYGDATALSGLSFSLAKGECLGILGPSGCGKTTTLRLIAGLERPDGGEIFIDGKKVADSTESLPPYERKVGLVFQDLALWPHMTIAENIAFCLSHKSKLLGRGSGGEPFARKGVPPSYLSSILSLVHLDPALAGRYPHQLSGGQRQRAALARTIAPEPEILLLDEPLASLDPLLKRNITQTIREIKEKLGITIIYVTHNLSEIEGLADRILLLKDGRLEQDGTLCELRANPATEFVESFIGASII